MHDRPDYFGRGERKTHKESGGGESAGAEEIVWRTDSWSVGPVLRREACSSEEVLLLRRSLRGPQRAAKCDADQDAYNSVQNRPKLTSVDVSSSFAPDNAVLFVTVEQP